MKSIIITLFVLIAGAVSTYFTVFNVKTDTYKKLHSQLMLKEIERNNFLLPSKHYQAVYMQYVETQSDSLLVVLFMKDNSPYQKEIGIYQWRTKRLLHYIQLPKQMKNHAINQIKYISSDSILLSLNGVFNENNPNDSTLLLINDKGDIKKIYDLTTSINGQESLKKNKLRCDFIQSHPMGEIAYYQQKVYGEQICGMLGIDDNFLDMPLLASFDIKEDVYQTYPLFHYPKSVYNYFWGDQHYNSYPIIGLDNRPVVSFGYSPYILSYNPDKQNFDRYYAPSYFIDSIRPLAKKWDGDVSKAMDYSLSIGNYNCLLIDKYRYQYMRYMWLPHSTKGSLAERNQWHWGIMLLNSQFEVLGEADITDLQVSVTGFCRKGLMALSKTNTEENTFEVKIYEVIQQQGKYLGAEKGVNKKSEKPQDDLKQYLKEIYPEIYAKKDVLIITIPMGMSCGPCVHEIVNQLLEQPNEHIYPIFVFENEQVANQYLKNDKLIAQIKNVSVDKNAGMYNYISSHWNPILYWIKKGKIGRKMCVQPDNLSRIKQVIIDYSDKK